MNRVFTWLKKPENAVFLMLLFVVGVYGIINDNLDILAAIYLCAFGIGLIGRLFFFSIGLGEKE